jgi:phospholipase/carboxylesterase
MVKPEPRRRRIGPLDTIEIFHSEEAPWVVLFHGYGADSSDLAPLAQMIATGRPVNWLFPNGPHSVPLSGHDSGRAWFPLRMAELEAELAKGKGIDLSKAEPPGMKHSRQLAQDMLQALGAPMEQVVLGGFSQGAMLATDVVLRSETAPAGLVILSGSLVDADTWKELAKKRKGLRFFQSHGEFDPVLALAPAQSLASLLIDAGLDGMLTTFPGQHEIPQSVLSEVSSFLRSALSR